MYVDAVFLKYYQDWSTECQAGTCFHHLQALYEAIDRLLNVFSLQPGSAEVRTKEITRCRTPVKCPRLNDPRQLYFLV